MICKHPRECFLQPAHKRSTAVIRLEYVETRNTPFIEHRHGFVVDRRTYDSSGIELLVAAQRLNLSAVDVPQQQAVASGQFIRDPVREASRSEEHTSELQSLMRISYAVFCLKKKKENKIKRDKK